MKEGDKFLQAVKQANDLRILWVLFISPKLKHDYFAWLDFFKANKN